MTKLLTIPLFILALALSIGCGAEQADSQDEVERGESTRGKADAPGSCQGPDGDFCGGRSDDGCFCDDECVGFGDCCSDRVAVCEAPQEVPGSCEGACGGQSTDGCWCDSGCAGFGDCCEDITEICEGEPMPVACDGSPTYRVTFTAAWNPSGVPNPHWSPLIGGTHSAEKSFWSQGALATNGVEDMAETGSPDAFAAEVSSAINASVANQVLQGGPISTASGSSSMTFGMNGDFPLVSLTSMMAPSPDWFVGVEGLSLCPEGDWLTGISVDLEVFDAGTDSGTNFTSADSDTNPAQPVSHAGRFIGNGTPLTIGSMTFERIQ